MVTNSKPAAGVAGQEQALRFWSDFYLSGLRNALEAQELTSKLTRELLTQSPTFSPETV